MVNFEKHILKAIPKVRKEYLKEWNKEVHNDIYVELDSINIVYEDDCSWADVTVRWGRDDDSFPFYHSVTFAVYPRHLKYIVGYILGIMSYKEDEGVKYYEVKD